MYSDSDAFAGTERHISDLTSSLHEAPIDVELFCPCPSPLATNANRVGVKVHPLSKRGRFDYRAILALAGFLRGGKDRVIHCHNGRTAFHAVVARTLAGRGAVVATQHFITPNRAARKGVVRRLSNLAHAWVGRRIDHVIAISDAVRQQVVARGEASTSGVTRIYNGMSIGVGPPRVRADLRARLGWPLNSAVVVCAARLEAEKCVDVLVAAFASLREARPNAICYIAGDGAERKTIEANIRQAGAGDAIRLLGFRSDVKDLIAAADLFVLPAAAEPFGLVVLEAMEAAVAVVATDAGGPREIVVGGETGWLVKPRDPQALADAIVDALSDEVRLRRVGHAGRERLLQHFTAERMARETTAVYETALSCASQPSALAAVRRADSVRESPTAEG